MSTQDYRSGIKFVLQHTLKYSYLFIISLIVCGSLAYLYSSRTQLGPTQYFAQMGVRKPQGIKIPIEEKRLEILFSSYSPEWEKESWLKAPQMEKIFLASETMEIAGEKIDYDMRYSVREGKDMQDIYNQTPIRVHFLDAMPDDHCSMVVSFDTSGKMALSEFEGYVQGQQIHSHRTIQSDLGQTVKTPLGRVEILRESPKEHYPYSMQKSYNDIVVSKIGKEDARMAFDPYFEIHLNDNHSMIRLELSSYVSERLSMNLLNTVMVVADSIIKERVREEVLETRRLIGQSLAALDTVGSGVAKQEVVKDLETRLYRTYADEQIIYSDSMLSILDHARVLDRFVPSNYIYALSLIIGLAIPLLILTLLFFYRDSVFEISYLPSFWRTRTLGSIALSRKKVRDNLTYWDPIRRALYAHKAENKLWLVSSPSTNKLNDLFVEKLAQNIELTGVKVCTIKLLPEGQKTPKNSRYNALWNLKPGWVGSPIFEQQIADLYKRFELVVLEAPSPLDHPSVDGLRDYCDACIYTIDHNQTSKRSLDRLEVDLTSRDTQTSASASDTWAIWIQ